MMEMIIRYSSVPLDVNSKNCIGATPLHVAALGNTEAVSVLLNYHADVNSTTNLGYTPLQYAAKHGFHKACRRLYISRRKNLRDQLVYVTDEELNVNWQNSYKQTALHMVIDALDGAIMQSNKRWAFNIYEDRYTKIIKFLLKIGADVNRKDYDGNTPLHIATRYEMEYIVKLLLHYNADIHDRNNRNETAIKLTKNNSYLHVKNLIKVNKFNSKGE